VRPRAGWGCGNLAAPSSTPSPLLPPPSFWSEALHGIAWADQATVFPQVIGWGATWDAALVQDIGAAIAVEARAKHAAALSPGSNATANFYGLHFEAPNVNLFRDPRWGRGQETFGEAPVLAGVLGAAFIRGMQFGEDPAYLKTATHAKHFLSYSLDSLGSNKQARLYIDYNLTAADVQQTYLVPFQYAVQGGNTSGIMCAYDSVGGIPMCLNPLIQSLLREQLNFTGYLVSDLGAIDFSTTTHHYTPNDTIASALGLKAGTDQCLGEEYRTNLAAALAAGEVTQADIDVSLARALVSRFQLGEGPRRAWPSPSAPPLSPWLVRRPV
jgi:beta-glucosidase